jgi:TRAP-type mannitol/chloroaromatic compound transport system permease small subunit
MKGLDRIWRILESAGAILLLVVALIFAVDVVSRYLLGLTYSWIIELEWYLTAIAILLSFAPALAADQHVRVDVIRSRFGTHIQKVTDRIGHVLILLPWVAFLVYASSKYAYNSYLIGEGSPDPGGLPLRWLIKALVPLGFLLLGIEGLRQTFITTRDKT